MLIFGFRFSSLLSAKTRLLPMETTVSFTTLRYSSTTLREIPLIVFGYIVKD